MSRVQSRKARDERYYQANKDAINRRRRERRQSKKERDKFGAPRLKLVGTLPVDLRSADGDLMTFSDQTSDRSRPACDEPPRYQKFLQEAQASDHPGLELSPAPGCDGPRRSPSDCDATDHVRATDTPATDQRGSALRASDQDQAADLDSATNHDETDHDQTSEPRASDYRTEPAMIVSYEGIKNPPMENLRFQGNNVYTFPSHSESILQKPIAKSSGRISLLVGFHLIVTLSLAALGTCLQFEFYKEHDVLPGYALPLAVAGAASMLALATVRFPGIRDWPRKLVYAAFYVFFVASSSYHVLSKTWDKSTKQLGTLVATNLSTSDSADRALEAMTKALEQATKNRAYKTMGILGAAVAEKVKQGTPITAAPEPAGISRETVRWTGAVILIVLRALLEAAQAIGATALRGYFGMGKYGSGCSSRAGGTAVSYQ